MNQIKRAVIMAAGFGSRLRPLTETTPKPLIRIKGKPIIEGTIERLRGAGIKEIVVVTGYKKECFSYLSEKYGKVSLIENPYYDSCNNISSLYAAREFVQEAFIIEADLIVENGDIFDPSLDLSGYLAFKNERPAEWALETKDGIITRCRKEGGEGDHQLIGISKWNKQDGELLKRLVTDYFEDKGLRNIYWDEIPLFMDSGRFKLKTYEISSQDVTEIDTPEDLMSLDRSYISYFKGV